MPPGELLLARLAEMQRRIICALGEVSFQQFSNPGPGGYVTLRLSMSEDAALNQVLDQLKNGEDHWDGRKKGDLSLEILSTERMAIEALSFVDMDHELALQAFAQSPLKLQRLTQQILGRLGLHDGGTNLANEKAEDHGHIVPPMSRN